MLKFTKQQVSDVIIYNAMKNRTHLNNWVIPKNYKSRKNLKFALLFALIYLFLFNSQIYAQDVKYRRSSLSMILLHSNNSSDSVTEINSLKEIENIFLEELQKQRGNVEEYKQDIDNILWGKENKIDVNSIKKIALDTWNSYPFPDKYDNNNIKTKNLSLIDTLINLSKKDLKNIEDIEKKIKRLSVGKKAPIVKLEEKRLKTIQKLAKKKNTSKKFAKALQDINKKIGSQIKDLRLQVEGYKNQIEDIRYGNKRSTIFTAMKDQKKDIKIIQPKVENQLNQQQVAPQLVRQWFSSKDGKMFDMSTIQQRGLYDASMLDVNLAKSTVRGMSMLEDAGEELLNNTFVTITNLNFFSNKPIADMLRSIGKTVDNVASADPTGIAAIIGSIVKLSMDLAAAGIEDGYTVFSKTFLYKLKWNDEVSAEFYNIWGDEAAFEKMNFQLEYVGVQYEKSVVNAGVFSKKEDRQIDNVIQKLVIRNLDENFANLQKNYDVFKPKVPVKSVNPLTAEIGMKEGLKGGEKFEILEITQDPKTGRTKWVRIGTTTVDKKFVWDNRYNAGDQPDNVVIGKDGQPISVTTFSNNAKAQPGMFLRQIK